MNPEQGAVSGGDRRVIICGSRRWHDRELISSVLYDLVMERGWRYPLIVHGAARGADRIADEEAGKAGLRTEPHPADWDRYGKRARIVRNEEMAALGAELCIAFWDGRSTGTESGRSLYKSAPPGAGLKWGNYGTEAEGRRRNAEPPSGGRDANGESWDEDRPAAEGRGYDVLSALRPSEEELVADETSGGRA